MSGGYVKLHRSLWESADFPDEPFSKREAFLWLVAEAAWKPRDARVGNHIVSLDRGDCAFSFRFLASAWNWSLQNVRTFIKNAVARKIITLKSNTHCTIITVCNYGKYQSEPDEDNTRLTHAQHTPNTNKNKGKKERREESPPIAPPKGGPKKAKRLPDDWTVPDNYIEFAIGQGWAEKDARDEADCFRDYWVSVGGQRAAKADWLATWRNWIRRAHRPKSNAGPQRGNRGRVSETLERLKAEGDSAGLDAGRHAQAGVSATDLGAGRRPGPVESGVVIDLHPVRSGGSHARTGGDDPHGGFEAGRPGRHDRAVHAPSDRLPAVGGFGSGFRLDAD